MAAVGRAVGYVALFEQAIPGFGTISGDVASGITIYEARFDVELFGHHIAPNRFVGWYHSPPGYIIDGQACSKGDRCGNCRREGEFLKVSAY